MLVVHSVHAVSVRLTAERWQHIIVRHPEMHGQQDKVLETVASPHLIQQGDFGELLATRLYPETPLTTKYMVVAYREMGSDDGFIMTAYFTTRPSARRAVIWKP
jgi:hypothetical protein